jgi:23S rRNA pseudouridine1911/1915/1917 synthase
MKLHILYEDNHIIAVEKEAGILSQQDSTGVPSLLDMVKDYIKDTYKKPGKVFLGLVHRLDKPVSGVIVFARTSKAAQRLHQEFAGRSVKKIYVALVEHNIPLEQDIWIECEDRLVRKRGFSEKAGVESRNVKTARMRYMAIASNERYTLLLVELFTGRKHQIRAQLAAQKMPIVGDDTYGSLEKHNDGAICLHAVYMRFMHPTKKEPVELYSPIPERMASRIDIDDALWQTILKIITALPPS